MEMDDDLESLMSKLSNNNVQNKRRSENGSSESGSWIGQKWKTHPKILATSAAFGLGVPIVFPILHIFIFYLMWGHEKNIVDSNQCTCSCWDTVFKGPYEGGVGKYKHVYFNSTINTMKMWIITVLFVVGLYEVFKHVAILGFKRRLRPTMTLLLFGSLHSHYYAWWGHWNYYNDEFYSQWSHQLFFTVTELLSTALVLFSLDKRKQLGNLPLILIVNIAAFHICCAMWDQFYSNVFQLNGKLHQVLRDIFLMSSDCIQVIMALYELRKCAERKATSVKNIFLQRPNLIAISTATFAMLTYIILCPRFN